MIFLAVGIPTLVGSLCSLIAASFIFVCYFLFPFKPHFRHILILNLATADLINAFNNTVSGIYAVAKGNIPPGPACTANAFVGQLSVQGTDFSILLIAIVTVIALKSPRLLPDSSLQSQILLSLLVWVVPIITSVIGLALNAYGPVGGNWCWIVKDRSDLRYALTHGWRMGIIISTISLYVYLFFYFRQVFSVEQHPSTLSIKDNDTEHIMTAMANPLKFPENTYVAHARRSDDTYETERSSIESGPFQLSTVSQNEVAEARKKKFESDHVYHANPQTYGELTGVFFVNELEGDYPASEIEEHLPPTYCAVSEMESRDILATAWATNFAPYAHRPIRNPDAHRLGSPLYIRSKTELSIEIGDIANRQPTHATDFGTMNRARNKKIQRALLLNAYPIAYVLLWLPGLINRFVELSTGNSNFALQVLQSSTQFVGVANAITYGFNERVRMRILFYLRRHVRH